MRTTMKYRKETEDLIKSLTKFKSKSKSKAKSKQFLKSKYKKEKEKLINMILQETKVKS